MALRDRFMRTLLAFDRRWKHLIAQARTYDAARQGFLASEVMLGPHANLINMRRDPSCLHLGASSVLLGEILIMAHGGEVRVGDWCYIGEGSRIWSANRIEIGDRVFISHNCNIHDWNAHSFDPGERHEHFRRIRQGGHPPELPNVADAPVRIASDVWIGFNSTVLKGVTIGEGAVVAANSLVLKDVPAFTLVAGSPARVLRSLREL